MSNILEALKERRLRSAKSSIAFNDNRDSFVSARARAVKSTLGSQGPGVHYVEESRMAALYYRMVDEYGGSPAVRIPAETPRRGLSLWRRVVRSCGAAGVDPEPYMRAQFAYFHKCFGRIPKISQLATDKAQVRAIEYIATNKVQRRVVGAIEHKTDLADVMRNAEKLMQTICRAQGMTREEVYRNLVLPGLIGFPKQYLAADPVYRGVVNSLHAG